MTSWLAVPGVGGGTIPPAPETVAIVRLAREALRELAMLVASAALEVPL
jgi:hypothetical protein